MPPAPLSRVVLIDDDRLDCKFQSRAIARTGLASEIKTFSMAKDALAWLRDAGPEAADIIFLDINMPAMDGFELLDAARELLGERFSSLVVMMLTTSLDPGDQARAGEYPVVRAFIPKSLTSDRFRQLVAEMTGEDVRPAARRLH